MPACRLPGWLHAATAAIARLTDACLPACFPVADDLLRRLLQAR
jgi:hypothetical protein